MLACDTLVVLPYGSSALSFLRIHTINLLIKDTEIYISDSLINPIF